MAFRSLQRFGTFLDRMVPPSGYAGILSPADERAAGNAYRAELAAGLLSMAGPQTQPVSFGQAVGAALPRAMAARDHRAEMAMRNEMMRKQIEAMDSEIQAQNRRRETQRLMAELAQNLGQPAMPADIATPAVDAEGMPVAAAPPPTGFLSPEVSRLAELLAQAGDVEGAGTIMREALMRSPEASASPIGKLFDDYEAAVTSGNALRAKGLETMIASELAKANPEAEEPIAFSEVRAARNDVIRNSDVFLEAQSAYQRLLAAAAQPSPAGDMSIIYSYQRMQDPGSRVTESEFVAAGRAGDLPDRVQAGFNRVFNGELLETDMRNDFVSTAGRQFTTYRNQQERLLADARQFAERNSLSVDDVVPSYLVPQEVDDVQPGGRSLSTGARFDRAVGATVGGLLTPPAPARTSVSGVIDRSGNTVQLGGGVTLEFID